ncbi:HAD family phosphatase [Roseibium sp. CAU 1637]|uniref:HAD family phosphatase n=1 Tax=Roseibium limicola TaxID=2816037 RepID=A0A939ER01_9HYPH|nr:HAD family phosphatase [Roseibium limicola]MBO0346740.1 HAD family phosphatase [Roseibium limicola]
MSHAHPAIIFDCDGVLVDSEVIYLAAEAEHLATIGLTYDENAYRKRFLGLNSRDLISGLRADHEEMGSGTFPEDFHVRMMHTAYARMETDLEAISGIHDLLRSHIGPRAVASSSALDKLHWKLEKTGISPFFDHHIYSGDQVENGKPAPDLFLMTAQAIATPPADCIVIEDSRNGVQAGIAAGMTVWGFVGGGHNYDGLSETLMDAGADRVFTNHTEMADHLARLASA